MKLKAKLWIDFYAGGILHALLKPAVLLLGKILRRNHDLSAPQNVAIFKLLGGGSLIIAYPALLALKQSGRVKKLTLITGAANRSFADIIGLFDETLIIRDDSLPHLLADTLHALWTLRFHDTFVDFEIHSRLSTIFALLTLARNRIGFYTANSFWRRGISTHLLFCNQSEGIYHFYDQIAALFNAPLPPFAEAATVFTAHLQTIATTQGNSATQSSSAAKARGSSSSGEPSSSSPLTIAIAPCCSELGRERMLTPAQWRAIFEKELLLLRKQAPQQSITNDQLPITIQLLAGPNDLPYTNELATALASLPAVILENLTGKLSLKHSAAALRSVQRLYAIDSSLLHIARLLNIPTTSYWGPTNPTDRLRPSRVADHVHYHKLTCSPCVHIAAVAPCKGRNLCMQAALDPTSVPQNPVWLADAPESDKDHHLPIFNAPVQGPTA